MSSFARNIAVGLLIAGAFVAFMCLLGPWWSVYEFDADEGLNLQKALLVGEGYRLYADIWSDQPPFLTWVLSAVQEIFPFSIGAARAMVLGFSALLLVSLFRVVKRFDGNVAAVAAVLLLVSSRLYLGLSVSVMIGLPAVALAVVAFDCATAGSGRGRVPMALAAGALFGAAMLTKMFVVGALPALLVALWLFPAETRRERTGAGLKATLAFIGGFLLCVAVAWLVPGDVPLDQLLGPHWDARALDAYGQAGGPGRLVRILANGASLAFYFTLVLGLAAFLLRPKSAAMVPVIWLTVAVAVLASHRPLWQHQVLVILPPLAWLGGVGFKSLFLRGERLRVVDWLLDKDNRLFRFSMGLALAAGLVVAGGEAIDNINHARRYMGAGASPEEQLAQLRLQLFDTGEEYLVTDKPIDAFYRKKTGSSVSGGMVGKTHGHRQSDGRSYRCRNRKMAGKPGSAPALCLSGRYVGPDRRSYV